MSAIKKAEALAQRAAHDATPIEEARTCGVLLAKLLVKENLLSNQPTSASSELERLCERAYQERNAALAELSRLRIAFEQLKTQGAKASQKAPAGATPGAYRKIRARFDSRCKACSERIYAGDSVYWRKGETAMHEACHSDA